jgi:D-sedoheptulose 7-phosphate isomerase
MDHLSGQLRELQELTVRCQAILPAVAALLPPVTACLRSGGKLLTCGNGGSATDAAHLAEELTGKYKNPRRALPALCLCADAAAMTCIANDWSYHDVFARQVEAFARPGDVLIAFTTSGNSENCLRALQKAKALGATTIALLGKDGGKTKGVADHEVIVPSATTARIQEIHTWILHQILEAVEADPELMGKAEG